MKRLFTGIMVAVSFCLPQKQSAQGFGTPLTYQGMDRFTNSSVVSRAAGGVSFGLSNDITLMFSNPASLDAANGLKFSVSTVQQYSSAGQTQQYGPLSYYSNFSLLMEGLTGGISDPVYDSINHIPSTGADTVQRPFDAIRPNWNRTAWNNIPVQAFAAIPFSIGETKISFGAGIIRYADLNWYFQNNNVLDPSILSVDPNTTPIPLNTADSNSIPVKWSKDYQERSGGINGYGGAVSVLIAGKLSVGASGMVLQGSTDDFESSVQRGTLRFYSNYFRLEPSYSSTVTTGTSDYSGLEFTLSALYKGKNVSLGFSVKPPTTITRKFTSVTEEHFGKYSFDSTASVWSHSDTTSSKRVSTSGEDQLTIPLRGSVAVSVKIRDNVLVGLEYELRPYSSAKFTNASGSTTHPWTAANIFHLGIEYTPVEWIFVRAGVHEQAEVFQPVGNPIKDEPIGYTAFTGGLGMRIENIQLNLSYEYAKMKYTDLWASAVSINTTTMQNIAANISYDIPW
ncbi:MAG: hypothetical protein WCT99_09305 [Bacteroidota bacterium]